MSGENRIGGAELWADASHELRQPVQALLLLTHSLRRQTDDSQRDSMLRAIESGLDAVYEMLEFLTRLALLDTGRRQADTRPIDLFGLQESMSGDLRALAEQRAVNLRCRHWRGRVRGDGEMLPIILKSLICNAIDEAEGTEVLCAIRPFGRRRRFEIYYRQPVGRDVKAERAFTELRFGDDDNAKLQIVLGRRLATHACGHLGYDLKCEKLNGRWQRLSLEI